jgi:menaquinone-dependent protoporphyrinogen IX oxidase
MADVLGVDLVPISQAQPDTLTAYDLIGFGSGVYYMKFHMALLQFVEALPAVTGKRAFVFCYER